MLRCCQAARLLAALLGSITIDTYMCKAWQGELRAWWSFGILVEEFLRVPFVRVPSCAPKTFRKLRRKHVFVTAAELRQSLTAGVPVPVPVAVAAVTQCRRRRR